ncbi:MAG TPA: hypothetical protein VHT53_06685 [Candidatus Elarobacter sp.]|jgi:hypothetical protein|nr:hypothetical protein [Candidatus Elarobacter sp.]
MVVALAAMALGGLLTAVAIQIYRAHHRCADATAWLAVANANMLLRADLDHLCGDDRNDGLRELRAQLEAVASRRQPAERALLERYNGLVCIAIAFGEKVHDADGNVDMRAVANRRAHVQGALTFGERIEAALGGIAELARDAERGETPAIDDVPKRRRARPVLAMVPSEANR